jgi:uncharacterized protein (TIGR02118 family)
MAAKLLVLYNQPTDPETFDRHYTSTHLPIARVIPGLRALKVSAGPVQSPSGPAPYHLVAELAFDSLAALQVALASSEGASAAADLANFATGGAELLIFEEREV